MISILTKQPTYIMQAVKIISVVSHVLYPDLKFSCSGNITKISFIAVSHEYHKQVVSSLIWIVEVSNNRGLDNRGYTVLEMYIAFGQPMLTMLTSSLRKHSKIIKL